MQRRTSSTGRRRPAVPPVSRTARSGERSDGSLPGGRAPRRSRHERAADARGRRTRRRRPADVDGLRIHRDPGTLARRTRAPRAAAHRSRASGGAPMTTLLITVGVLLVVVGIPGVLGLLDRAHTRWRQLDVADPAAREYLRERMTAQQRRAVEEARAREVKPS